MTTCGCADVDRLASAMRLRRPRPVDPDEVAVVLEANGFTDGLAVAGYRQSGVFALAEQVLRRLCAGRVDGPECAGWDWRGLGRWRVVVARLVALAALGVLGWRTALPVLLALPLGELLVAWHGGQARRGFARYADRSLLVRHLRGVGWRALLALVPPVLVATGLLSVAGHLPAASATAERAALGVLFAGSYGLVLLLAARRRVTLAAVIVGVAGGLVPFLGLWSVVGTYLVGLVLAALVLFDPRRFSGA
jgi:hypothetical protein